MLAHSLELVTCLNIHPPITVNHTCEHALYFNPHSSIHTNRWKGQTNFKNSPGKSQVREQTRSAISASASQTASPLIKCCFLYSRVFFLSFPPPLNIIRQYSFPHSNYVHVIFGRWTGNDWTWQRSSTVDYTTSLLFPLHLPPATATTWFTWR